MVGTSFVPGVKQDFLDLPEKNNSLALESFRDGRLNLIVATSVLEEVSILHSQSVQQRLQGLHVPREATATLWPTLCFIGIKLLLGFSDR